MTDQDLPDPDDLAYADAAHRAAATVPALAEAFRTASRQAQAFEERYRPRSGAVYRDLQLLLAGELAGRPDGGLAALLGTLDGCMAGFDRLMPEMAQAIAYVAPEAVVAHLRRLAADPRPFNPAGAALAELPYERKRFVPGTAARYRDELARAAADPPEVAFPRALAAFFADPRPLDARVDGLADGLGLGRLKANLRKLFLPAAGLALGEPGDGGVGASRLGGVPDVPPGFVWPAVGDRPLRFLLQVDLGALPGGLPDFPAAGLLAFFYDADGQPWGPGDPPEAWRAYHFPDPAGLAPAADGAEAFPAHRLRVSPWDSFSAAGNPWEGLGPDYESEAEADALEWLERQLRDARTEPFAQLGGFVTPIQGDDPNEETGLDPRTAPEAWRLLIQIGSDDAAGMMWGDGGRLYYLMKLRDLRAGDFGALSCYLECY